MAQLHQLEAESAVARDSESRSGQAPRALAYVAVVAVAAAAALALLPGAHPSPEPAYAPVGAALLLGALLTVRLRPGERPSSLLLLPALVAYTRFGSAVLPALIFASVGASVARGVAAPAVLAAAAHDGLAFTGAYLLASSVSPNPLLESMVFALVFPGARLGLWRLAEWIGAPPAGYPRVDRPEVLLSLSLAPLAALPLIAWTQLGDGALLLVLLALLAVLVVVRDATNLATARAEVEIERDHLARANALQDELIHLITHELRNPLTTVLGFSSLARSALHEQALERLPGYLESIERGGKSMERLVENLLQLSRLEQSEELPPPEPVALEELARAVVEDLEPLAQQKQQQVRVEVSAEMPTALASAALLREALSNLVSNAIKYTPEGGVVRVSTYMAQGAEQVVLQVTDTGIGLSEEDQQRLFTKFYRSADPRVRRQRGSGLGLALTRTIVERMGGTIEVESQLNQGTTFRLLVPAARNESA